MHLVYFQVTTQYLACPNTVVFPYWLAHKTYRVSLLKSGVRKNLSNLSSPRRFDDSTLKFSMNEIFKKRRPNYRLKSERLRRYDFVVERYSFVDLRRTNVRDFIRNCHKLSETEENLGTAKCKMWFPNLCLTTTRTSQRHTKVRFYPRRYAAF